MKKTKERNSTFDDSRQVLRQNEQMNILKCGWSDVELEMHDSRLLRQIDASQV